MNRFYCVTILVFSLCFALLSSGCSKKDSTNSSSNDASVQKAGGNSSDYTVIDWTDLLPDEDLEALENPPEYLTTVEDGSEDDQISSQLKAEVLIDTGPDADAKDENATVDDRYQQALISKDIRSEFDGRNIRIPGFIVPLEFDENQTITTFFLVPFFGACIHMPPPPPNQIIYAEYEPGIKLEALYDPFWINGTVSTTLVENDLATAAYSITVAEIEPYIEFTPQEEFTPDEEGFVFEEDGLVPIKEEAIPDDIENQEIE